MASLLILTQPFQQIISCLPKVLTAASEHASKRLYIHLDSMVLKRGIRLTLPMKSQLISTIYSVSPAYCPKLDVRVLLYGFKYPDEDTPISTHMSIDQLLIDTLENKSDISNIVSRYKSFVKLKTPLVLLQNYPIENIVTDASEKFSSSKNEDEKMFDYVVMGGTLDRLHPGHKVLLSECLLRTSKNLTAGIADGPLLKKKLLKELIEPCSVRIKKVKDFLTDVDNRLEYELVPIFEPLGPTGWDPLLQMVVVSEETKKGIDLINNHRLENGLSKLESYIVPIFDDCCRHHQEEETKYSSSSHRMRLLGTKLRDPVPNVTIPDSPYVIGLTGGSASGKTKVAERLQNLGVSVIDCDKLGHKAYAKNTNCYMKLLQQFGKDIVNEHGEIDRNTLGSLVFKNKKNLKLLNGIVWPEIRRLTSLKIENLKQNGAKIIVLDAAILLEAEWDKFCHEVWVCIISREEAIERISKRDGKTGEEAAQRIDNQMTNEDRVAKANVVFCTQWSYEFTHSQIEKAMSDLILPPHHKM